jgi:hypothetical protein
LLRGLPEIVWAAHIDWRRVIMGNEIGFTALICALGMGMGMGMSAGCGTEDPGAAGEPVESVSEALVVGQACVSPGAGAAASSVRANTNNVASNAIDQNTGTRWESEWADPQWLRVDLGRAIPLTGVTLNWQNACGKDYTIQTADAAGGPWTTVFTVTGNTTAGVKTHNFTKTARFVRMNGTKRCTGFGYSLIELQANAKMVACNLDNDADGFGGGYLYCGACPANTVSTSSDCNDGNSSAKPSQTGYFLTPMTFANGGTPSFDWNCDGHLNWKTTSGWLESDGVFSACTDFATHQKVDDCSRCEYNFVPVDASDCGHHRCSLGAGEVDILCH